MPVTMTSHELYVAELMWNRGFTCVDIAESLGFSVEYMQSVIRGVRKRTGRFPYRHRVWMDHFGRPMDEAEVDDGDGEVPRRP